MKLSWFGYSCFIFENDEGTKLLTDPFIYDKCNNMIDCADIITISHYHHNNYLKNTLKKDILVLDNSSFKEINYKNINIKAFKAYHDKFHGFKRGENIIFKFNIDNLNICHLGDLGHLLSKNILSNLLPIDILIVPTGGNFNLTGKEAAKLCKIINPKIIIPMHFGNNITDLNIEGVENFLYNMKNYDLTYIKESLNINCSISKSKNTIILMNTLNNF